MKPRIFYMGREVNGRFSSFKVKVKRVVSKVLWFSLWSTASILLGAVVWGGLFAEKHITYAEKEVDVTPQKIEALKDDVIDRLLKCESAGHSEEDAIIIYDNNKAGTLKGKNVWSIGQLQWKVSTIQKYAKDRDGEILTQKEAVLMALDTKEAKELAKWAIFETEGGIWNWKNCADKLSLAQEVTIIKKLSK